ncbi:LacI family DNA-binding transcriptional regulator [Tessaracoccus sp. G1721]
MPDSRTSTVGAKAATVYDVARVAGVSHQTVARYLNGAQLKPANRDRVRKALEDLDYRPNESARLLATNRSRRIGALASDLDERSPQMLVNGAAAAAREAGYMFDILAIDGQDPLSIEGAVDTLTRMQLAGLVVIAPSDAMLERVKAASIRCPVEFEAADDDSGSHPFGALIHHLADLGHQRLAHVAGPTGWRSALGRTLAYRTVAAARGLTNVAEGEGDWSAQSGFDAMENLDADVGIMSSEITAVVAANDSMALGAMHWLRRNGLSVPGDVSVVGYDGVPDAAFYTPPLTTIQVDSQGLGRRLLHSLLSRIDEGFVSPPFHYPARLVVRESTAQPRRS